MLPNECRKSIELYELKTSLDKILLDNLHIFDNTKERDYYIKKSRKFNGLSITILDDNRLIALPVDMKKLYRNTEKMFSNKMSNSVFNIEQGYYMLSTLNNLLKSYHKTHRELMEYCLEHRIPREFYEHVIL